MKLKLAISAIAACALMGAPAVAGPKNKKQQERSSASSAAGGVAAAGPRGAVAGGAAGSQTSQERTSGKRAQTGSHPMATRCAPGSASTSTTGAVYTGRRSGSAAINTNGSASGSGTVRSTSEGEVYSSTTRQGSDADAYGNSTAVARESTRPC